MSLLFVGFFLSYQPAQADLLCNAPGGQPYNVQNAQQCQGTLINTDSSLGSCEGQWVQRTDASSGWACQPVSLTNRNQISSGCLNNPSFCNAQENSFLDGQGSVQSTGSLQTSVGTDYSCPNGYTWSNSGSVPGCVPLPATPPTAPTQPTPYDPPQGNKVCIGGVCTYTPLEPLPCPPGTANCQSGTVNFPLFLSNLFRLLISVGGLFAVVMLVVAGIGYMISEGAGDIDKAKSRAKAALWGLLLLTSCWLILNTINPNLLKFDLTSLGQLGKTQPGSTAIPPGSLNPAGAPAQTPPTDSQRANCEKETGFYVKTNPDNSWSCQYAGANP